MWQDKGGNVLLTPPLTSCNGLMAFTSAEQETPTGQTPAKTAQEHCLCHDLKLLIIFSSLTVSLAQT